MFFVYLIGTAGSGKSLLTATLEKWLVGVETSVTVVNLDPGVENPPYTSDVDIREYIDYGEIIEKFGLGPNGALVASLDMTFSHIQDIQDEIIERETDYVLVDCPGQMELFAYRNSGPLVVEGLKGQEPALSLYLLDSNIARTPDGYLSSMLLGLSINIRFAIPQLNVLSKIDILSDERVDEIVSWSNDSYILEEALQASSSGLRRQYSEAVLRMLDGLDIGLELLPVSSKNSTGVHNLYASMQIVFMGGDNVYDWA